jgi:hypothetical protein
MKKIFILIACLLMTTTIFSQENIDVIYLKNGSIIKGEIVEMVPNERIKIETEGGNVFVYTFDDIEKIEKEKIKNSSPFRNATNENDGGYFSEYFGKSAIGPAIGGGGLLGLTYRYFPNEKIGIEGGAFYRPAIYEDYYEDIVVSSTVMIAFGPVFYLKTSENWKGKIKKNGISAKVGVAPFGELNEFMGAINWVQDTYKPQNKDRYFSFELGLGAINAYKIPYDAKRGTGTTALIYWKLNWFFHLQ